MACALPYAIGAQVAYPDRQVIAYCCDGALTMLMGEIATCVKYSLPIKIFVSKNNVLGLIRWEQMMFLGHPEYGVELENIDFVKVAEACGAKGLRLEKSGDAARVVREALDMPGPVLIEALVDPFEPVMPGHIFETQAKHYAESMRIGLRSGQPSVKRIAVTMSRDILEISETDRGYLTKALVSEVPALLAAGQTELARQEDAAGDPTEPQASFDLQRSTSQERLSGQPNTAV
jgi:pyruvate dehydrogenase (quinone)